MALIYAGSGKVAIAYDDATGERGYVMKLVNRTGKTSVKGELVAQHLSNDNEVRLLTNGFDGIGVIQEAGIAEGSEMWVWKIGSHCQVLAEDGVAATRGYVALGSDTVPGRAEFIDVPVATPGNPEHWREIGHVCESKGAGTNVLVLCDIHFN